MRYYADPDKRPIVISHNDKNMVQMQLSALTTNDETALNISLLKRIEPVDRVTLLESGSLVVTNITRRDSGLYTCYAYNVMGNATANIRFPFKFESQLMVNQFYN